MGNAVKNCQSCGMPIDKDPNKGGTNSNGSKSNKYCGFCFQNGKFTDEGITLKEKIEKNVQIAVSIMGIPEKQARRNAENLFPNLERWKCIKKQKVNKPNRKDALISQSLMLLGVIVLLFSSIYMVSHFNDAGRIVNVWLLSIIIGCCFVYSGFLTLILFYKRYDKKRLL